MARAPVAKYGFIKSGGTKTAPTYTNVATGQSGIVSRQRAKAVRLITTGEATTNEQLAKFNRQINPIEAASRPARNKTSLRKLAPATRSDIAAARIAHEKELEEIAKREQEERNAARKVEFAKRKKIKTKKINARLLRPGNYGARVDFNDYEEYLQLYDEAKATNKIIAYGLGIVGVNERTGQIVTPTIYKLRDFDSPLEEEDFYETMEDYAETKSYMIVLHYYIHLAFKADFAKQHTIKSKQKVKQRKKRK